MITQPHVMPQLNSTNIEPVHLLEKHLLQQCNHINEWFAMEWQKTSPPVYGSVDLRNAGFKLAPIDMNLFPAGFNNLNPNFLTYAISAAKKNILQMMPQAKRILIIPENHTRNLFYWENIKTLRSILENADFQVRFGSLSEEIKVSQDISLASGEKITIEPLLRKEDKLQLNNFLPDAILLNNDLSDGIPEMLQNLNQLIMPPASLGWSQRLKSEHFQYYAKVARDFAKTFDIDPWLISPLFRHCGQIDFMHQLGLECLIINAEILFEEIEKKYAQYGISHPPFLVVKADAGTYGMAVMTVRHADELKSLNRKQRTRMSVSKGGQPVNRVIIQEGVYTFEMVGSEQAVAEPVVYLWGDSVVGGFYRVHKERGIDENLNAPGMHFEPIAFSQPCHEPCRATEPEACQNRFYLYGIVAKLSMLAAAREIHDQINQ
ncbi:MAG: glutamate--cysteine ligase [Gammaproteobacteria bacterium RIFCSPHIGHO2_12_FULL_37_14]|nr:MAG: glutamate--cysteine ligase [Gammaproteobacteria bacterium RIFCSPHIGHO2_12_FULL_37_14]